MLCMQASLMDETHAMRSKSRHADKISSSEYRIQLQMGMNTYQYHKAYEAALNLQKKLNYLNWVVQLHGKLAIRVG